MTRRMKLILGGLAAVVLGAPIVSTVSVIVIERMQLARNEKLANMARADPSPEQAHALVVYFSRSGNTELMALEIARVRHAPALRLDAPAYRIGFAGWRNAMRDARKHTATIAPGKVDLSEYDTIYVGSPIWLYSPAPPIWQFVRDNDLTGKRVILFNSMNSKFEQRYIDAFAGLVRQQGGTFIRHIYIIRGRMPLQMDTQAFLAETRRLVGSP